MKQLDENIREIFSGKLKEFESNVPDGMWESIQAGMGNAAASGGGGFMAKIIASKFLIAAGVVVTALITMVVAIENNNTPADSNQNSAVTFEPLTTDKGSAEHSQMSSDNESKNQNIEQTSADQTPPIDISVSHEEIVGRNEVDAVENARVEKTEQQQVASETQRSESAIVKTDPPSEVEVPKSQNETKVEMKLTGNFKFVPVNNQEMLYFFMAEDVDATSYHWDFGDGAVSNDMSPSYAFSSEGTKEVTLIVKGKDGDERKSTKTVEVFVPGKIIAPNIFTPNGDGYDDVFDYSKKSTGIEFKTIIVRDMSGVIVYQGDGVKLWDGNDLSGNACVSGTYQFYLEGMDRNHEMREKRGTVFLQR